MMTMMTVMTVMAVMAMVRSLYHQPQLADLSIDQVQCQLQQLVWR